MIALRAGLVVFMGVCMWLVGETFPQTGVFFAGAGFGALAGAGLAAAMLAGPPQRPVTWRVVDDESTEIVRCG